MKKRVGNYVAVAIGLVLLIAGLAILKAATDPEGVLRVLPYICIGLGCGIFGHGMGNAISRKVLKNSPDIARQMEIEKNDERNVMIASRAKAKAFDLMTFVFGALMLSFALMEVDLAAVVLLVAAYLFVVGYSIYCRFKFEKEM